jgi:hypothetical protein
MFRHFLAANHRKLLAASTGAFTYGGVLCIVSTSLEEEEHVKKVSSRNPPPPASSISATKHLPHQLQLGEATNELSPHGGGGD